MDSTEVVQPMLLDIGEVAKKLGLGQTKTWELVATGQIFSVRVGKRRLVPVESVEKFVAELIEGQAS
jgi:excisionase family DNA binding protein